MDLIEYLPFWNQLNENQQAMLQRYVQKKKYPKGTIIHNGSEDCIGLLLVSSGQLRVYIMSDEGKEMTLYRLFEHDMCLLSASCVIKNIEFDVIIETEREAEVCHIPAEIFKKILEDSIAVSNYANELMATRFSDVMWLMDQMLNKKLDTRLAAFLLEESQLTDNLELSITHEQIAHHLGTVREVITRMLKYFQSEEMVSLTRGNVRLLDVHKLEVIAAVSLR